MKTLLLYDYNRITSEEIAPRQIVWREGGETIRAVIKFGKEG